jgi:hypothetical protein
MTGINVETSCTVLPMRLRSFQCGWYHALWCMSRLVFACCKFSHSRDKYVDFINCLSLILVVRELSLRRQLYIHFTHTNSITCNEILIHIESTRFWIKCAAMFPLSCVSAQPHTALSLSRARVSLSRTGSVFVLLIRTLQSISRLWILI